MHTDNNGVCEESSDLNPNQRNAGTNQKKNRNKRKKRNTKRINSYERRRYQRKLNRCLHVQPIEMDNDTLNLKYPNKSQKKIARYMKLVNKGRKPSICWFKVTIPLGHKYSQAFILKCLTDEMHPNTFVPIKYTIVPEQEVHFYVDDYNDAQNLKKCNNKIKTPEGLTLAVDVQPGFAKIEQNEIDENFINAICLALNNRVIQYNNAIDLTCLHRDPELVLNYFCALSRPVVLRAVIDLVSQHMPNIHTLILNNNKLKDIRQLKVLKTHFPNLRTLHLENNRIKDITFLSPIKGLDLHELNLRGNPCEERFKGRTIAYIEGIQRRFPNLQRLDNQLVPKKISFDLNFPSFPKCEPIFAPSEDAKWRSIRFLNNFFHIYDCDRNKLTDLYHENAIFSLTTINRHMFRHYFGLQRNLLKCSEDTERLRLLKSGRLQVTSGILSLPKTQHIPQTTTLDVCLSTETMMMLVVTGIFKELEQDGSFLYFCRTMVLVPSETGICIGNDQLHISHVAPFEMERCKLFTEQTETQIFSEDASFSIQSPHTDYEEMEQTEPKYEL